MFILIKKSNVYSGVMVWSKRDCRKNFIEKVNDGPSLMELFCKFLAFFFLWIQVLNHKNP